MSFKENLKKKMLIDSLSKTVSQSIGPSGMSRRVDKETMRRLLALSPFVLENRRDLELYFRELEPGLGEVLVLDNELPVYRNTSLEDVTLRKSPELKEMVSIRNIIKILNDSDILMCKGREALGYVQRLALDLLDLRYDERDIEEMADEGLKGLVYYKWAVWSALVGDFKGAWEKVDLSRRNNYQGIPPEFISMLSKDTPRESTDGKQ